MKNTVKCALFCGEGFEECEALIVVDLLRRAGISITTVSITQDNRVKSSHDIVIATDQTWNQFVPEEYEVLIVPGGKVGTANCNAFEPLRNALVAHTNSGKWTCAICAGPSILGNLGLLKGKKYTCFPGFESDRYEGSYQQELVVQDGKMITGRGMGATIEFARTILKNFLTEEECEKVDWGIQHPSCLSKAAK